MGKTVLLGDVFHLTIYRLQQLLPSCDSAFLKVLRTEQVRNVKYFYGSAMHRSESSPYHPLAGTQGNGLTLLAYH